MNRRQAINDIIMPALGLLPRPMISDEAVFGLLAFGYQESRFTFRDQLDPKHVIGPALGLWQFELGSKWFGGGVWGVYKHPSSRFWLKDLCSRCGVAFEPVEIWHSLAVDDVFAAGVARLLMFTDRHALPNIANPSEWWRLYIRTWNPGKPRPKEWSVSCAWAEK